MIGGLRRRARAARAEVARVAVERLGVPPARLGYRFWQRETVPEWCERTGNPDALRLVHPASAHHAPLPLNIERRDALPHERGWWGFSFRDVPERHNDPTFVATLPGCSVVHYRESPDHPFGGDYYVGILNGDQRSVELREIRFRPKHAAVLTNGRRVERIERATLLTERVYHNYSHWLTAHLPKFILLRDQGMLDDVLLPPSLPENHRQSLRMLGIEPDEFRTFDPDAVQRVGELTVVGSDRFRPELVRSVRDSVWNGATAAPRRKLFISRAGALRRRLLNEEEIWPRFAAAGFERVRMEALPLEEQVALMMDTRVLAAPHGAGLTNMIFCAPGTHVIEIACLGFPNPNFYALASALGHPYWLVPAQSEGEGHPLVHDLRVEPARIERLLAELAEHVG